MCLFCMRRDVACPDWRELACHMRKLVVHEPTYTHVIKRIYVDILRLMRWKVCTTEKDDALVSMYTQTHTRKYATDQNIVHGAYTSLLVNRYSRSLLNILALIIHQIFPSKLYVSGCSQSHNHADSHAPKYARVSAICIYMWLFSLSRLGCWLKVRMGMFT